MNLRQQRHARVYEGRKAIAAMVNGTPAERGEAIWVSYNSEDYINRRGLDMMVVAEASGQKMVFVDARSKTKPRPGGQLFRSGDPIWLWRSEDGWVFGQIAPHWPRSTYSPADEPQSPSWEEMHGGRGPEYFATKLSGLAPQFRSGDLSCNEYETAKMRVLDPGGRWNS